MLITGGLVFARVLSMLAMLPMFRARGVPKAALVLAGLAIAALIAPTLPEPTEPIPPLPLALVGEVAMGLACGLVVGAVYAAILFAGELVAMQSALALGSMFDPIQGTQSPALGTIASLAIGLGFLALDLHLRCLEAVAASFLHVPPGLAVPGPEVAHAVQASAGSCIILGVQLAGPVLALGLASQVIVAILARMAPKMNPFFSIGTTMTVVAGVGMLGLAMPWIAVAHLSALTDAVSTATMLLGR